ncbi:MAG: DUF4388 domain-containing protein [Pseudomonadota bacterium]
MKYDGKTVTIDSGGFIISSDADFLKFWQDQAGEWKITSTGPGLLILERKTDAEPSEGKRVLIGGEIRKEGWLIDIISFISNSKWTGTLTVTSHGTKRQLFFDKAALRHATSNVRSEYLGEIMFRGNLIGRRQLDDALKKVSGERRIGEVLIRQGICTASEIFKMIYRQVEEIFYATLLLDSGYFYFTEGLEPVKLPAILSLDTQSLLLEAVKRIDEISYFKKRIPGLNIVLKRKPRSFPPGMPHVESEFLGKCDGQKTLAAVAKEIMVGEFDAMKLAYRFLEEGALEVVMTERTYDESAQFAVRNFNSIINLIHNEIDEKEKLLALLGVERNYINSARKEGEVPEEIAIDEKGCIEASTVISALDKIKVTNKMGYIIQIMSQYVFFVLFSASTYLPRQKQQQLNLKVHTLIQKVSL